MKAPNLEAVDYALNAALNDAYAEGRTDEREESGWISIEYRRPEPGAEVLVARCWDHDYEMTVATFVVNTFGAKQWIEWHNEGGGFSGVTHWRPLPEPPKP